MTDGVTELIQKDTIRSEIDATFPNNNAGPQSNLQVEHQGYSHSLLGNVLEELLRYWIEHTTETVREPPLHYKTNFGNNNRRIKWNKSSQPIWGTNELGESQGGEPSESRKSARRKRDAFIETGLNVDQAIQAALWFVGQDNAVDSDLKKEQNSFESDLIDELQDLFHIIRQQNIFDGEEAVLSPNFGQRRYIIEGHADLLIDNVLLDIKTTADPTFKNQYWRQLICYYTIASIDRKLKEISYGRADFDYPEIDAIGIYFARFGEAVTISKESFIQNREDFENFRAWLTNKAIEINGHSQKDYEPVYETLIDPYDFEQQQTLFDF